MVNEFVMLMVEVIGVFEGMIGFGSSLGSLWVFKGVSVVLFPVCVND